MHRHRSASLCRYLVHSGIIEPGPVGMPQHMAVDPGKEKRIIRITGEHDLLVAIPDDPLERLIQTGMVMAAVVAIQKDEVIVAIDIGLAYDPVLSDVIFLHNKCIPDDADHHDLSFPGRCFCCVHRIAIPFSKSISLH